MQRNPSTAAHDIPSFDSLLLARRPRPAAPLTRLSCVRRELYIEDTYVLGREAKESARKVGFEDERAGEAIRSEIERFLEGWGQ